MSDQIPEQPEEDFAALFAASEQTKHFKPGQTVRGTIVAIAADVALVNVGAKGEASIAIEELQDDDGRTDAKVGDRIEATIISTTGGITLSRRLQRGAASRQQLEQAFRSGLPVEGKVDSQVKGGYSVTIAKLRAFCPASQIDVIRDTDPASHLGRVYAFRVIEFREDGRKFVVSRRALLEEEQKARAEDVRRSLAVGAVITGRVVSVREFGAFVDLGGGVQGLLHISEMGWSRVADPSLVAKPGDEITVKILRIEEKNGEQKIALGLKQLSDDPWSHAAERYPIGTTVNGRVTRIADFGAFVELEPGVIGLLPMSETGLSRDAVARKSFQVGAQIGVAVVEIDPGGRRIRLSLKAIQEAQEAAEVRDYATRAAAEQKASISSLADKLRGALGSKDK